MSFVSRFRVFRSAWIWLCAALVPMAPALASPSGVRAEVRDASTILPTSIAMRRGEAIRLGVEGFVLEDDGHIIDIEFGGTLVALAEGSATVRPVTNGTLGAPIRVLVTGSPVSSLRVDGAPVAMAVGANVRMRAVAYRLDFTIDDVTADAVWTSSNPEVIAVSEAGAIRAVSEGVAIIDAWIDGSVARSGVIRVE